MFAAALCALALAVHAWAAGTPPNIVMIMTDDQDLSSIPFMPRLSQLISTQGVTFRHFYASVPVCCPSRSSFFTGQYQHNNHVIGNVLPTNCSSLDWQKYSEPNAFPVYLQQQGYLTSFAGKYLNGYGNAAAGGVAHVPPGWTNWQGLVGNSIYYGYTLSNNGQAEVHGNHFATDYLPDLILNKTLAFIDQHRSTSTSSSSTSSSSSSASSASSTTNQPMFLMLSTPSCHDPSDPAPQYADLFPEAQAPRDPAYNASVKNTHWIESVQGIYGFDDNSAKYADLKYRRRAQTLQSVEDIVEAMVEKFTALAELDNTYFVYTTDNGYHLGSFGMVYDKRQPWESDILLPLFIRGPGIQAGLVSDAVVSMPDLTATLLDIAGIAALPLGYDGQSMLSYLQTASRADNVATFKREADGIIVPSILPISSSISLSSSSSSASSSSSTFARSLALIEYHGEGLGGGLLPACSLTAGDHTIYCATAGVFTTPPFFDGHPLCACQDALNNTYNCLRFVNESLNFRYCEFADQANTIEYFDFTSDPYQLRNLAQFVPISWVSILHERLAALIGCAGSAECTALLMQPLASPSSPFEPSEPSKSS